MSVLILVLKLNFHVESHIICDYPLPEFTCIGVCKLQHCYEQQSNYSGRDLLLPLLAF